jgi:hypothetical protein
MATRKLEVKKASAGTRAIAKADGAKQGKSRASKGEAAPTAPTVPALESAGATEPRTVGSKKGLFGKQVTGAVPAETAPSMPAEAPVGCAALDAPSAPTASGAARAACSQWGAQGRKAIAAAPAKSSASADARTRAPARDPRLPEPGAILRRRDRSGNVRCACTINADGVDYAGSTYRSLSAAACAAAKDLGIKGAQNGYVFWGLVKAARATPQAPLVRLQKSWERYSSCVRALVGAISDDEKREVLMALGRHREAALGFAGAVAG